MYKHKNVNCIPTGNYRKPQGKNKNKKLTQKIKLKKLIT